MNAKQIAERLREQAAEIAAAGHAGWGNTMTEAADLLERMAWVPVSERLPESERRIVLVYSPEFPGGMKSSFTTTMRDDLWKFATHWMPLPDPPSE